MKRRFLSILLCLLLAVQLLPAGALAAGEGDASAVTLEAGGVSISGTTDAPAYAATDSEGVVTPGTESDPWNIRWDGQTLTLKNAVIHSEEAFGIALTFHSKSDVTIELEGTNQVSSATWANGILGGSYSCGVWLYTDSLNAAGSKVTIRETEAGGSLTATGGSVASGNTGTAVCGYSAGIGVAAASINSGSSECGLSLTLESGAVTARGGTEDASSGGNMTVSAGACLHNSAFTITGGSADLADNSEAAEGSRCWLGAGVYMDDTVCAFRLEGGELKAAGQNGEEHGSGICGLKSNHPVALAGGTAEISGSEYGIAPDPFGIIYEEILDVTVTGGDITLQGGALACEQMQATIAPVQGQRIMAVGGSSEADAATVAGFPFTSEGTADLSGCQYIKLYTEDLSSPTIINAAEFNIPAGLVGTNYTSAKPLTAQGGEEPYTFSLDPQVPGLSIDAENYLIYQRPDTPQDAQTVTITVTDKNNMTGSIQISIGEVEQPLYTLTVVNGTDTNNLGPYKEGTGVWIQANEYDGKRFLRWESDAGGVFENPEAQGTTFTMPASDVTVTATYEEQVTVTYLANGGSGNSKVYQVFPGPYKLKENYFDFDNGIFQGWAMGSPEGTVYQPGDTVEITGDTTFYALWAQPEDCVIVGGRLLYHQGKPVYAVTDADGQVTLAPELSEDDSWNIKWDGQTLTLRNAHVADEISSPLGWEQDCAIGICKVLKGTTILMEGENLISCKGKPGQYFVNGIYHGYEYATDETLTIQNNGNTTILWEGEADYVAIQSSGSPVYLKNEGTLSIQSASESNQQVAISTEKPLTIENNHKLEVSGPLSGITSATVTWTGSGSAQIGTPSQPCAHGIYTIAFEMNSGELAVHAQGNAIEVWDNNDGKLEVNGGTLTAMGGANGGDGSGIYSITNASFNGGVITAGSDCPTGYGIFIDSYTVPVYTLIGSGAAITAYAADTEGSRAFFGTVTALPQNDASLLFFWGADENSARLTQVTERTELDLCGWDSMGYFHCEGQLALYPYQAKYVDNGLDCDGLYWSFETDAIEIESVWTTEGGIVSYTNYKSALLIERFSILDQGGTELRITFRETGSLSDEVRNVWFPSGTSSGMLFFCPAIEQTPIAQLKIGDTVLASQAYEVQGDALVIAQDCLKGLEPGEYMIQCTLEDGRSFQSTLTVPPTHTITLACEPAGTDCSIDLAFNQPEYDVIDPAVQNSVFAEAGTDIMVRPSIDGDYQFTGWKLNGEIVSTSEEYSFTVEGDASLTMVLKAVPHVHEYGDWEHDETGHWKACECGATTDTAAHTASGWITVTEPTETTEGLRNKVCTVCEYEMESETIPALVVIRGVDAGGIRLSLSNETAGTCLAALYDSDGRMLTAGFLNVAANAGDISISFPAFAGDPATVKFFFLDKSYAPIYRCITRDYASE